MLPAKRSPLLVLGRWGMMQRTPLTRECAPLPDPNIFTDDFESGDSCAWSSDVGGGGCARLSFGGVSLLGDIAARLSPQCHGPAGGEEEGEEQQGGLVQGGNLQHRGPVDH